ncbi:MAG: hypothetical protein K1X53_11585 [Candidatus Sumerlaeaceae bacterium]|nr:hypothetical protein [Candidatus Sumerlaeaceae bacterium]
MDNFSHAPRSTTGKVILLVVFVAVFLCLRDGGAAPNRLNKEPILSPDKTYYANVEWENVGFIGILRMRVWDQHGKLLHTIELPQINPQPANLSWIDGEWVACESYIGENGSGFFYVNARSGRAYLMEIVAKAPGADWIFHFSTNDPVSSSTISCVSRGRNSIFPILLRSVPQKESEFYAKEFINQLTTAVDAYGNFRRSSRVREITFLGEADIRPDVGAIVAARVDGVPELLYFPAGADSPADMLARLKRVALPTDARIRLDQPDPPELSARWGTGAEFTVAGVVPGAKPDSAKLYMKGRIEGANDKPFDPAAPTLDMSQRTEDGAPVMIPSEMEHEGDESGAKDPTEAPADKKGQTTKTSAMESGSKVAAPKTTPAKKETPKPKRK